MAKKEFQAESKKLMDMMINSIYTNKGNFPAGADLQRLGRHRQAVL